MGALMSSVTLSTPTIVALSVMTAAGYVVATVGLKLASDGILAAAAVLIVLGFTAATIAEIILLRHFDLSMIYIMIIALETLLIVGFALWLGEQPSMSQAFGGVLVFCGLALTVA